jgi:hypothetical protein
MKHKKVSKKSVNSSTGKSSMPSFDQMSPPSIKTAAGGGGTNLATASGDVRTSHHVARKDTFEQETHSANGGSQPSSCQTSRSNSIDSQYEEESSESNRSSNDKEKFDVDCMGEEEVDEEEEEDAEAHATDSPTGLKASIKNNEMPFNWTEAAPPLALNHSGSLFNFQSLSSAQQFKILSQFYNDMRSVGNGPPTAAADSAINYMTPTANNCLMPLRQQQHANDFINLNSASASLSSSSSLLLSTKSSNEMPPDL